MSVLIQPVLRAHEPDAGLKHSTSQIHFSRSRVYSFAVPVFRFQPLSFAHRYPQPRRFAIRSLSRREEARSLSAVRSLCLRKETAGLPPNARVLCRF
jgi:hypothetical protein